MGYVPLGGIICRLESYVNVFMYDCFCIVFFDQYLFCVVFCSDLLIYQYIEYQKLAAVENGLRRNGVFILAMNFRHYLLFTNEKQTIYSNTNIVLDRANRTKRRETCQNANILYTKTGHWIMVTILVTWFYCCCEYTLHG